MLKNMAKDFKEQIREAIIIQKTEDQLERLKDQEYLAKIRVLMEEIFGNIKKTVLKDLDDEEQQELEANLNVDTILKSTYGDPDKAREMMYKNVSSQLLQSRADFDRTFNLEQLSTALQELGEDIIQKVKGVVEELATAVKPLWTFNAALITGLDKLAKKKGLEVAVLRDSVYAQVRELKPTPQDYVALIEESSSAMLDFAVKLPKVIAEIAEDEGEEDEEMQLYSQIMASLVQGVNKRVFGDYLDAEVRRIYGRTA